MPPRPASTTSGGRVRKHGDKKRSHSESKYHELYSMHCATGCHERFTVPVSINDADDDIKFNCRMLIDTGALQDNFVDLRTAAWLQARAAARTEFKSPSSGHDDVLVPSGNSSECLVIGDFSYTPPAVSCDCLTCCNDNSNFSTLEKNSANCLVQKRTNKKSQKSTSKFKKPSIKNLRKAAPVPVPVNKKRRSSPEEVTGSPQKKSKKSEKTVKSTRICSGIKGMCVDSPGEVTFTLTFFNEEEQRMETSQYCR